MTNANREATRRLARRVWWRRARDRYATPVGLVLGVAIAAGIDRLWVPGGLW